MATPLIQVRNLEKDYVNDELVTPALRGVNLDIDAGEFVSIMGPSGSGKSTLMHILGFLDVLTRGSYYFEGSSIGEFEEDDLAIMRRNKVGFVFQTFNLLPKTSVLDNVMLPLLYAGLSKKERRNVAIESVKSVGLEHRLFHLSNQLSGGERQRVAIARAFVNNPSVVFADEPTGNLDTKTGHSILSLLVEMNEKGNTIVMVTHENEAAAYSKRIIRMRDGVVTVTDEKPQEETYVD